MKTNILTIALASAFALGAYAQDKPADKPADAPKPPGEGRPGGPGGGRRFDPAQMIERMKESLGLTEDQVTKIKAIYEEGRPAMEALRADTSLSDEARREKSGALRKAQQEKVAAVLTPEQKTKFEEMAKQMRERRGQGGPGGDRPRGDKPAGDKPADKPAESK